MADMQTKFVEANGLRFEVLEEGTGDRLALCLHGFPEHAISWRHQIPVLAGMGYRVWAVNQRGYGRSTRPTQVADYALPHLVDDVTALINAASAKNVVLIGHDWGAMVAWCFAAQQRHPLDRLVIMNDPHPLCFRAALKHWRQLRKSWYVALFQLPMLPERMLTMNGGAMVRRMFGDVALPPDVLAVYTRPDHRARCCDGDAELVSGHTAAELASAEPGAGNRGADPGGVGRAGCSAGPNLSQRH